VGWWAGGWSSQTIQPVKPSRAECGTKSSSHFIHALLHTLAHTCTLVYAYTLIDIVDVHPHAEQICFFCFLCEILICVMPLKILL
jgi:hypothetical protein